MYNSWPVCYDLLQDRLELMSLSCFRWWKIQKKDRVHLEEVCM